MSSNTSNFHKRKQSAAVLKHSVLNSYVTPFVSKTGSTSIDNRVAVIDGYAGPGRYEDGEEGSGAMLLRKANELAAMKRALECHFVEDNTETASQLRAVARVEGNGTTYTITDGNISASLPKLLDKVKDIPLFVYLDPCGLPIPLEEVARIFDRPSGPGAPASEVLINLTAGLRRFAGMLYSDKAISNSLGRLDSAFGGDWWRDVWLKHCPTKEGSPDQKLSAELAVVEGYAERLRKKAGGAGTWIIDVKPRADLKPVYYLVFATRHLDGMIAFGEATSLGLERWRKYNAEISAEDTLFGEAVAWEEIWKADERKLKDQWVETLTARLTTELAKGQSFRIIERAEEILGTDLVGVVRSTHLRAAVKEVLKAGKTVTNPKGVNDLYRLLLIPS